MRLADHATAAAGGLARAGYSLPEAMVAFVLLGIGLAGVCPLVVMQSRMSRKVALGLDPGSAHFGAGATFSLVPACDGWARKLGVAASFQKGSDPLPTATAPAPVVVPYVVAIVAPIEKSPDGQAVTIHVSVTASPP
ncbi:MAG: prepilin-type N-terminal cleavage/methylation domain-containing protein [Isosphaerales bacterium]